MADWRRIAAAALPGDDPHDAVQTAARDALARVVQACVAEVGVIEREGPPPYVARISAFSLWHAVQLLSDCWSGLMPREKTFPRAHAVSYSLRTLADLFARQISIWSAPSPEDRLAELQAESLRQEQLALEAAAKAGAEVSHQRSELKRSLSATGSQPARITVVDVLTEHSEYELLTVYRWESAHVHAARAAVEARGATLDLAQVQLDVASVPLSLWRVGQLTWASYGVGLRVITFIASKIGLALDNLLLLDQETRPVVKSAASRQMSPSEPPSPPYWEFDFPVWNG